MAYVPVPKDLSKIKTKLAFNLTKRQLVCFSSAAAVGLPAYLFSRGSIGNSAAMFLMIGLMLPFFFLAMYERDGLPLEKVLKNIIRTRFLYPRVRPYGHSCTPFPQPIQASFTVKVCWAHYGTKPLPQCCGRGFV